MIGVRIKYMVSLFGNISSVSVDPENLKNAIDTFANYGLTPSTFNEVNHQGHRTHRLMMISLDSSLNIQFASDRIDIIKVATDMTGSNLGELSDFIGMASDLSDLICNQYEITFNRLSLIAEYLLTEMDEPAFDKVLGNTLPNRFNIGASPSKEWSVRDVEKTSVDVSGKEEEVNSVITLERLKGEIATSQKLEPYDRMHVVLDINTVAENTDTRFLSKEISNYFDASKEIHDTVMGNIEGLING